MGLGQIYSEFFFFKYGFAAVLVSGQYFGEVLLRGSTVVKYGLSGGTVLK